MADAETLRAYICEKFAEHVGLPKEQLFGEDLTMAAILSRADKITNSVDLMEAFARTANGLRKEHGLKIKLPTLPLETPISRVLEIFLAEVEKQRTKPVEVQP